MAASFSELVKAAKAAKAERIESPEAVPFQLETQAPDAKALKGGAGEPFRPSTLMPAALQALAQPLPHLSIDKVYDRYEQMKAAKNDAASKQGAAPNGSSAGLPTNPAKTATKKDVATDKPARTSTIPEAIRNLQSAPSAPAQPDQPLPSPAQTKRFDFNSKANADRHSRSMGAHVPDFAPPVGLEDSTQSDGAKGWAAGVAPPRGVKPSAGMICGMPSSAFDGWPEAVGDGKRYLCHGLRVDWGCLYRWANRQGRKLHRDMHQWAMGSRGRRRISRLRITLWGRLPCAYRRSNSDR